MQISMYKFVKWLKNVEIAFKLSNECIIILNEVETAYKVTWWMHNNQILVM